MRSDQRRPRWLRHIAVALSTAFLWSFTLAAPVTALTHQPAEPNLGVRNLSPDEMQKLVGKTGGGGHATTTSPAAGSTFPWEATVAGGVNSSNGNKLTTIPIVSWTARGGLPVSMYLSHNSQSTHNSELGQKWTFSYDLYLDPIAGGGSAVNQSVHWGDDLSYLFTQNIDGSYTAPTGIHETLVENGDSTWTLTKPDQTTYHYNTAGYCDKISDENGNYLTIAHSAGNYVTSITDNNSRAISLSYDGSNRITGISDPLSRSWVLAYNGSNDLVSVSEPALGLTTYTTYFTYTSHDIVGIEDKRANTWSFSYSSDNSLATETDPCSNEIQVAYASGATTVTDPNSQTCVYNYTAGGLLSSVTDENSTNESYTWDTSLNRTQVTTRRGYTSNFTFNSNGDMLTAEDPYTNTTTNTFNSHNRLLTSTLPTGEETLNTFDSNDNLTATEVKNSGGTVVTSSSFTVDGYGQLATTTDGLSHTTTIGRDTYGNITSVEDANSNTSTADFDILGHMTSATDALSHTVSYTLDNWERVTEITTPAGSTYMTFDPESNCTAVEDANSNTTSTVFDSDNRPLSVTKANTDEVQYAYDGTGQKGLLSSTTDGNGYVTHFSYNSRNLMTGESYADSNSESWAFDADGNTSSHTDCNAHTISYTLDHDDRMTGISYPTGTGVSYAFDASGRRTSMTDSTGTTGYTFDGASQCTQIAGPNGTVSYAFDAANRRTGMTLTGTGSWAYTWDAGNRLSTVTTPYSEETSYSYDAANRTTSVTLGNSAVTSYDYDTANRVTDVYHKNSGGTTLAHYQYAYDGVSNVSQRTDTDGTEVALGYDASDQLTSETRDNSHSTGYSITYTYDHNANRKTKVLGGVTDTYSYDHHDHLQSTSSKSYTYDNNGNCTAVTVGGNTTHLSYDYENRAVGITYPSSATNSFAYNGEDLRSSKTDSTGTFNYVCDGDTPGSAVLSDSAAIYTPGLSEHRSSASKFYHADALGSVRGITNASQTVTDSTLYDAFGMTLSHTGSTPTPFGFAGGSQYQQDSDSGLMLVGHRYYDCSIGRFISSDPAQAGDNWYAYCDNRPMSGVDPTGLTVTFAPGTTDGQKKAINDVIPTLPQNERDWINDPGHDVRFEPVPPAKGPGHTQIGGFPGDTSPLPPIHIIAIPFDGDHIPAEGIMIDVIGKDKKKHRVPATPGRIIGHEIGHTIEPGANEGTVIRKYEDPVDGQQRVGHDAWDPHGKKLGAS